MKLHVIFALVLSYVNSAHPPGQHKKRPRVLTIAPTTTTPPPIDPTDEWELPMPVAIGLTISGVTARGRMVEQYKMAKVARTYGNATIPMLTRQQVLDERHDVFTPQTQTNSMKEITPFGELFIGSVVARNGQGIIFELPQVPDLVIKYQANCFEISDNYEYDDAVVHPLIFDGAYGHEASLLGVSLDVLFVSPPAKLCPEKSGKCDFRGLSLDQYEGCRTGGGSVRYMIMRKSFGMNLSQFRAGYGGKLPFSLAMTAGASIMNMLEILHVDGGLIHGDIHSDNLMVEQKLTDGPGNYSLKMIDFGRSLGLRNYSETAESIRRLPTNRMFTQWQIDGHVFSPRDDVVKAIQVVTHLVHNYTLFEGIEKHYERYGYEALKWFKTRENWFAPVVGIEPLTRSDPVNDLPVSESAKNQIRAHLSNIIATVRGLNSPNQPIPYGAIRDWFMACASLAKSSSTTTTIPN